MTSSLPEAPGPWQEQPGSWQPPPYQWDDEPAPMPPRRTLRQVLVTVAVTVGALIVAGVLTGLLWHVLAPNVPVLNVGEGRIIVNDPAPEEYIASDGWFAFLGLILGAGAAIGGWMLLKRIRGPWLLIAVILGCLLAPLAAWQTGRIIGLGDYETWRAESAAGATYDAPPDLHAYAVLLIPAFAAAILLTLMAGWSNDPDLDRPGARPGYGHDLPVGPPPPIDAGASSDSPAAPGPTAEPAPPGPGPAGPPRG